jgi:hypothetical protein
VDYPPEHLLSVVSLFQAFFVTFLDNFQLYLCHLICCQISTIGKGNKTLGFIRGNLKDCTKPVKSAAYTSMVRPTMEYASSVWDPTSRKKIGNLEKVQKEQQDSFFLDKGYLCL